MASCERQEKSPLESELFVCSKKLFLEALLVYVKEMEFHNIVVKFFIHYKCEARSWHLIIFVIISFMILNLKDEKKNWSTQLMFQFGFRYFVK